MCAGVYFVGNMSINLLAYGSDNILSQSHRNHIMTLICETSHRLNQLQLNNDVIISKQQERSGCSL